MHLMQVVEVVLVVQDIIMMMDHKMEMEVLVNQEKEVMILKHYLD